MTIKESAKMRRLETENQHLRETLERQMAIYQLARKAPAFRPGMDSANAGGRLDVGLGVRFWFPAVKQLPKLCHPCIINLFPVFCRQANRANNQQFVRLLRWSSARVFCGVHCAILRHTNKHATT